MVNNLSGKPGIIENLSHGRDELSRIYQVVFVEKQTNACPLDHRAIPHLIAHDGDCDDWYARQDGLIGRAKAAMGYESREASFSCELLFCVF